MSEKLSAWEEGRRSLAKRLMQELRSELGQEWKAYDDLKIELDDTRAVLRRLCEDHGDNDWDDNLHLADALDKHLGRYLDEG